MTDQAMAKPMDTAEMAHPLIPAQRVNGADVYNQAKEKIGKIEDIAIDKRTGKVAYAIISFGGLLGIGEKRQPVPWSVLNYDPQQGGYVVPITQEFLNLAPKLDISDLSGWDDTKDREALHTYYGPFNARPYW
jgi:sporulation protein YlmC with PRC-barrel domain